MNPATNHDGGVSVMKTVALLCAALGLLVAVLIMAPAMGDAIAATNAVQPEQPEMTMFIPP